jgi:hypothetical protein
VVTSDITLGSLLILPFARRSESSKKQPTSDCSILCLVVGGGQLTHGGSLTSGYAGEGGLVFATDSKTDKDDEDPCVRTIKGLAVFGRNTRPYVAGCAVKGTLQVQRF